MLALALVAGEAVGFAFARVSPVWPWGGGILSLAALVAWGWRLPHVSIPLVFVFGVVMAARTECHRVETLEGHWLSAMGKDVPMLELAVEGGVEERELRKRGQVVRFLSHLGPTPLKVTLPREKLTRLPANGEIWRCRGWVSRALGANGRYSRRGFWGKDGERVIGAESGRLDRARAEFSRLGDRCALKARIGLGWCPELAALNQAILLGRRTDIPHARREVFVAAGTVHVFAISGLHVMFIAWMLSNVLAIVGVPIWMRGALVVPAIVTYTLATGAKPSAVRATMMAGIYLFSMAVERKGDMLTAWAVTALVVYGLSPERIYDTGCTLSFAVMLGIVVWIRWSRHAAPKFLREGGIGSFGVSLAAWAAGVPIAAHVFGRFTPGGVVANLAVLRLAPFTVAFGMLGIVVGFIYEPVAAIFNNLAAIGTFMMTVVSALVAGLPMSSFEIQPWTISSCMAWYITICGVAFIIGHVYTRCRMYWWRTKT